MNDEDVQKVVDNVMDSDLEDKRKYRVLTEYYYNVQNNHEDGISAKGLDIVSKALDKLLGY